MISFEYHAPMFQQEVLYLIFLVLFVDLDFSPIPKSVCCSSLNLDSFWITCSHKKYYILFSLFSSFDSDFPPISKSVCCTCLNVDSFWVSCSHVSKKSIIYCPPLGTFYLCSFNSWTSIVMIWHGMALNRFEPITSC